MIKYILKRHYKFVLITAIFSIICAFLNLLLPDILANIISVGIGKSNIPYIYSEGLKLILISLAILISSIMASLFSNKMGAVIGLDLREKLFKSAINLDEEKINNYSVASLVVRSTHDINQIQNMISIFFKTIIFTLVLGIGGIFKALVKGQSIPTLSIVVILSILLVALMLFILFLIVIPRYNQLQIKLDKINKRIAEILQGLLVIKVFNQEKFEQTKTQKINNDYITLEYFLNKIMSLLNPLVTLILNLCTIAIIYIIFKKAYNLTDLANMLAFSEYATQVISAFLSLGICCVLLPKAFVSFNRVMEIINTYNNIYDSSNAQSISQINSINIKNIDFSYPNTKEKTLSNINFTINKGESVAIIGPTGSGKSTLVGLLNRFYDVDNGSILLNDIDLRNIKLECINKQIATVFQNEFIMRSTINENLFSQNKQEINKAMETACIKELANNLNREIDFDGSNLSGGQKQRLSIARALLKKPSVLILDDACSAIDCKTEKNIMNNINKNYPNIIKIIISSRITSIKNVDKIIVIDKGRIIGIGKHDKLIKSCPTYKEIVDLTMAKDGDYE